MPSTAKLEWHTEKRKVSDLIPNEKNPRKISQKQIEDLKKSLQKFNLVEIPVADTDNKLIAGHQRVMVLKLLGRENEEIPVRIPNRKLTQYEYDRYLLSSNRLHADWDWDKLVENFDVGTMIDSGFDDMDLSQIFDDNLEVLDDTEFELEKEIEKAKATDIKNGNMFALGRHTLICGDSTKPETVKKLLGDAKISVLNNDIPYNIGLSYDHGISGKKNFGGKTNDKKSDPEYGRFIKSILENGLSVCQKNCHVFFWLDEKYVGMMQQIYREAGVKQKRLCFWIKNNQNPVPKIAFSKATELCLYGIRGTPYLSNRIKNLNEVLNKELTTGGRLIDDIMDLFNIWLVKRLPTTQYEHPTEKPPSLYEKSLRRCSKPGDMVLDMTAGSGSLMVACEQLKRTAYLVEIEPIFCQVILNRYEKLTNTKPTKIS